MPVRIFPSASFWRVSFTWVSKEVGKVIGVSGVLAGVVQRVDVDHRDASGVGLIQELEHFQVIIFDEKSLRCIS